MGDSEEAPEQEGAETEVGQVSLDVESWVGGASIRVGCR